MKPAFSFLRTAAAIALLASAGTANAWPRLSGEASDPRCQQALDIGRIAFRSTNASLDWPVELPRSLGSKAVLYRTATDISGGDALAHDPQVMSRAGLAEAPDTVFWQTAPQGGRRLAVVAVGHGWRGDAYSTYLLPAAADPRALDARNGRGGHKAVSVGTWAPPTVFVHDGSGALWFIDYDPGASGEWRIYGAERDQPICQLNFHPDVASPTSGLPPALGRWAAALDEALGTDGPDSGTLMPVSRLRAHMAQTWETARFRPWALADAPYNTAGEVEDGLAGWAVTRKRRAVLRAIHAERPSARRELAAYYVRSFGLTKDAADAASAFVLDHLFRSSFAFHSEAGGTVERAANPWPR